MEDKTKPNFEQVSNQESLPIWKKFVPTKQVNNLLPTNIKLVQLVQPKPVELIQLTPVYIFIETSIVSAQHESLK
jgi:hypothetical protein